MGIVIAFPAPLPEPTPERWAAIWAAADAYWPEYERRIRERETAPMGAVCPPRLRVVR